uniref:Uncharacterized protein n=1 Tax=Fusarium oxysporum f. sp. physali TaxID=2212625 RepID=A0A7U0K8N4_FUSOX|nr:hypothetical protein [Fusarium oxysporum f. sp. physali]QQY97456.1 hypothetical protein [Fusarium oxysporum f. sp. physali]QQY97472.1 hypothetical protein [Fusarium oxysporum f. sp. physali]QQY97488.1 hypothetical protein [Fusarium oxysporum f. sp. physali]
MRFSLSQIALIGLLGLAHAEDWDSCHCMRYPDTQTPNWCATNFACGDMGPGYTIKPGGDCSRLDGKSIRGPDFYNVCRKHDSGNGEADSCCTRWVDGVVVRSGGCFK